MAASPGRRFRRIGVWDVHVERTGRLHLDLGLGVGPYVLGMLHRMLTFPQLYAVAGVIAIVCFFLYYGLYGRRSVKAVRVVPAAAQK